MPAGSLESDFVSDTLLLSYRERCQGELSPNPGRCMCCSADGSGEPPKARQGGAHFSRQSHSLQGLWPHRGCVSVQPHDPHSPSAEEQASCVHPHGRPLPFTLYLGSYIKGEAQGGCTNGRAGVQQISALNIYLITESRGSRGRAKGWLLAYQCESWCRHHIPPASSPCLPWRQGELK